MRAALFGPRSLGLVSCCGLLLLVVVGCGPGQGKVSGRVLYKGEPLPGGRVTFRPVDPGQNSSFAELDTQGNYEVVLTVGEVLVSVDNRELEPRGHADVDVLKDIPLAATAKKHMGSARTDKSVEKSTGKYVAIPSRYYAAETSGLKFTVQGGEQKHDIELGK